jgi:hypothetical protein
MDDDDDDDDDDDLDIHDLDGSSDEHMAFSEDYGLDDLEDDDDDATFSDHPADSVQTPPVDF